MTETIGQAFVAALADKDAARLKGLLRDDVRFRAVTPGRCWESDDAGTVVDEIVLGTWFSPERRITEVLAVESEQVGPLERIGYRFGAEWAAGRFVVEQQAYLESTDGRISSIRILCSGYLPVEP